MAITGNANYNALAAATVEYWGSGKFANAVFDGIPVIKWMRSGGREKEWRGGRLILEPVMFDGNSTIQSQSPFQEVDDTPQEGLTAAQFPIALYTGTGVMSELEQALNSGAAQMIDLWEAKMDQMKLQFQTRLDTDVFLDGTQAPYSLVGLAALVSATGTYGNITRSGNTFWQAYVDSAAGVLSEDSIRTGYLTVGRLNTMPDLGVTTQTLFEKYESLIVPSLRAEVGKAGDLGIPALYFKGCPIIYDNNCQSGTMYFLTSQYIKWRPLTGWNLTMSEKRSPARQLVDLIICKFAGQITSGNPRYFGKLTGKTA